MFYSQSTGGFYTPEIHGADIPADAVEISEQQHADLMEGQAQGKQITADANGAPILTDPPPPTPAEIKAQQIAALQAQITPRRLRLAIVGTGADKQWLQNIHDQIEALQ